MEPQLPPPSALRRSDRVSIAFPMEVAGIDFAGNRFSERTKTMTVSRFGCCLPLIHSLPSGQPLHLRRIGTNESALGRVIAPMGTQGDEHLYGVATRDSCESLWGIRFSTSFYESLLQNLQDGVYFVNRDRTITYWNEAAERLSGYSAREVLGKCCSDNLLGHVDDRGTSLCHTACPLSAAMDDGQPRQSKIYLRHKDGHRVPVSVRVLPMWGGNGNITGALEIFTDASGKKNTEKRVFELERLAFRDALTGLPNRRFMELKVEQALEEHQRFSRLYGLLLFDLDGFKKVNDTHGHDIGDTLLKAVAETLMHGLRPPDIAGAGVEKSFSS